MNGAIQQWLARLHATPWRGVIVVTGGSAVLGELYGSPGASQTLLEGLVPCGPTEIRRWPARSRMLAEDRPHHGRGSLAKGEGPGGGGHGFSQVVWPGVHRQPGLP